MNLKLGSHVSMSGKSMLLGSAKEAESYGANTFMFYTGAPQNTKRKEISELNIDAAWNYMNEKNISDIVVHAPYIINLGNTVKPETYKLAVEFLAKEIDRAAACKSQTLILHPGAHVGAGVETGLQQVIKGLNEVLTKDTPLHIALETMAGKGTEGGRNFEELRAILDRVELKEKMGVCLDTCHVWDGGYDIVNDLDDVLNEFDRVIGLDRLKAVHFNDSMNDCGSHKDRHAKIGEGKIGAEAMRRVALHPLLEGRPFILETPNDDEGYRREIQMVREWTR